MCWLSDMVPLVQEVLAGPPPLVILVPPIRNENPNSSLDSLNFQRRALETTVMFLQNEMFGGQDISLCDSDGNTFMVSHLNRLSFLDFST